MASRRYEIGVGLLMLVSIAVAAFMAVQVGALTRGGGLEAYVVLPDATGLTAGSAVAVSGVQVGTVEAIELDSGVARARLSLDPKAGIRADVASQIRARSVLGEKFLALTPASQEAPLVVHGDTLPPAIPHTDIDQVINALGPVLASVEPEVVEKVLGHLSDALQDDPERLARMLDNADVALENVRTASERLPGLVTQAEGMIRDGRRTLAVIERRGTEAGPLLARADTLLAELEAGAGDVPAITAELRVLSERLADAGDEETVAALRSVVAGLDELLQWSAGLSEDEVRKWMREEGVRVRLFNQTPKIRRQNDAKAED